MMGVSVAPSYLRVVFQFATLCKFKIVLKEGSNDTNIKKGTLGEFGLGNQNLNQNNLFKIAGSFHLLI
jgi:hypothetical protein